MDSLAVAAHVGVIHITQQPDRCGTSSSKRWPKFDFDVFSACPPQTPVQIDAIRDLGHQRLTKSRAPVAAVILGDSGKCVATRVGGVVVRAIVVDGPIHELQMTVAADAVDIKEVRDAHFPRTELDAPLGLFCPEREEIALRVNGFLAERNRLMQHQPSEVWL